MFTEKPVPSSKLKSIFVGFPSTIFTFSETSILLKFVPEPLYPPITLEDSQVLISHPSALVTTQAASSLLLSPPLHLYADTL